MGRDFRLGVIVVILVLGAATTSDFHSGVTTRATALKLSADGEELFRGNQDSGEQREQVVPQALDDDTGREDGGGVPLQPQEQPPPRTVTGLVGGQDSEPPAPLSGGLSATDGDSGGTFPSLIAATRNQQDASGEYPSDASEGYPPRIPRGHLPAASGGYPLAASGGYPPAASGGYPPPLTPRGYPSASQELFERTGDISAGCHVPAITDLPSEEEESHPFALPKSQWFNDALTEGRHYYTLAKKNAGRLGRFRESKLTCSPKKLAIEMMNIFDSWSADHLTQTLQRGTKARKGFVLLMEAVASYGLKGWIGRKWMCGKWAVKKALRGPNPKCVKSEGDIIWRWLKDVKMCSGTKLYVCSYLQQDITSLQRKKSEGQTART